MFEADQHENIEKMYSNYRYMVNDGSLDIIHNISQALTSKDRNKVAEGIKFLYNAKSTEEFPNPAGFIPEIQRLSGVKVFNEDFELPIYNSPNYNMITVNGNKYDDQMDAVRAANNAIGDKVIFKEIIENVTDEVYAHHMKLVHSINTFDLDYGLEAAKFFTDKVGQPIKDLSPYILIVDILEAKQRSNMEEDISKTEVYQNLKKILRGTIYALNLHKIKVWTTPSVEYLKGLKSIKAELLANGHTEDDVESHLKSFQ